VLADTNVLEGPTDYAKATKLTLAPVPSAARAM